MVLGLFICLFSILILPIANWISIKKRLYLTLFMSDNFHDKLYEHQRACLPNFRDCLLLLLFLSPRYNGILAHDDFWTRFIARYCLLY